MDANLKSELTGPRDGRKPRALPDAFTYAAFISYSHATDAGLAAALQRALQRFAKPWYRLRALRVFRDQASLSANPGLWSSIASALRTSEFFILLASPQAAESEWVRREAAFWLEHHPRERLLIALLEGTITWDPRARDFDWERTDALPVTLQGVFDDEPRFVDLRWAHTDEDWSLQQPRFLECVADLAAPLHGRAKDDLLGEDVRQHRRAILLARVAAVVLATLAVIATVTGLIAVDQRNEARRQRAEAEVQRDEAQRQRDLARAQQRVATARLLAAQTPMTLEERPDRALLMAVAGVRASDEAQSQDALLTALQRTSNVAAYLEMPSPVHSLALSPDGGLLATGHQDRTVRLWDLATGAPRGPPLSGHGLLVQGLAFSPDGATLATVDANGAIVRRRVATGRRVGRPLGRGASHVAYHPDGIHLVAGDANGRLAVWDLRRQRRAAPALAWPGSSSLTASVGQLAYSADGRWMGARSFSGHLVVRDATTFEVVLTAPRRARVTSFAFSPDGDLVAQGRGDGSIVVTDLVTGPKRGGPFVVEHTGAVAALAFSPDGTRLVSGGTDRTLRLWDVESGGAALAVRTAHGDALSHLAYASDGELIASAGRDRLVALWRLTSRIATEVFVEEEETLRTVALAADADTGVYGHRGQGLFSWRLDPREGPAALPGSRRWIGTLTLSRDGRLAAAGDLSGRFIVWDVAAHRRLGGPLASEATGRLTALVALAGIKADTEVDLAALEPLAFSADGSLLAAASFDNRIVVWDVATRRPHTRPLVGHQGPVSSLAFSPDGRLLASGELTGDVLLWDVATGEPVGEPLRSHTALIGALAFSPDGRLLASGDAEGDVVLWRVEDRAALGESLRGHDAGVTSLAFSPDGTRLASGDGAGIVRLWDLRGRSALGGPFEWHLEAVRALAFDADGSQLVSAGRDGTVRWTTDIGSWIEHACEIANRPWRPQEWQQVVGDGLPFMPAC